MGMQVTESSIQIDAGGRSQIVSANNSASVSSKPIIADAVVVTAKLDVFVRQGASGNTTATNDGTDVLLLSGGTYRLTGITPGNVLAFYGVSASGNVYISPAV